MPRSTKRDSALLPAMEARARVEQTADDIASSTEMFFDAIPGGKLIPIERLHEWIAQPRKRFDEARLAELAVSIADTGVLEPLIVRRDPQKPGDYIVTAGMRRLLAARRVHGSGTLEQRARVAALPCIIREAAEPEAFADALVENLVRQDLTRREIMDAVIALQDEYRWSVREIARRTGRDDGDLSRLIRVGRDPDIAALVAEEFVAPTTAYYIVDVGDVEVRREIAARVRSGALRTGSEVQTAIAAELDRRAQRRATVQDRDSAPPPSSSPAGLAPGAGQTSAENPAREDIVPNDRRYGQVLHMQHPPRETPPTAVPPALETMADAPIPVQAHTRRVGASARLERLAVYIITSLNQHDKDAVDRATLLKLKEAQDRIARYRAEHETRPGSG